MTVLAAFHFASAFALAFCAVRAARLLWRLDGLISFIACTAIASSSLRALISGLAAIQ